MALTQPQEQRQQAQHRPYSTVSSFLFRFKIHHELCVLFLPAGPGEGHQMLWERANQRTQPTQHTHIGVGQQCPRPSSVCLLSPAHSAQSYECVLREPRRHDSNIPRSAPRHCSASPRAVEASSLPYAQMGKPQLTDAEEHTKITPHWTAEKGLEPSHLTMSPGSSQGPTDTEATSTRAHLAV